jgi:taurine dioxygenase
MIELQIEPVTRNIGAVVRGVDLREPFDDGTFAAIEKALHDHLVLFFRDQDLTDEQHLAFAGRFGEVNPSPYADGAIETLEDTPDSPPKADLWHTDMTFLAQPPDVAVLRMLDTPTAGGDTLWANLYDVHDNLSPLLQELVAGLRQDVHRTRPQPWTADPTGMSVVYRPDPELEGAVHPLVRVHPDTGRRALWLCGQSITGIVGLRPAESDALLTLLQAGVHDPNVQVRWRWQQHDVVVWDERCTNHRAVADHWPEHRLVRRCTVGGNTPVGPS